MSNENNYLSIDIPDDIKEEIQTIQLQILKKDSQFKSVTIDNLHMTLLFFGQALKHLKKESFNNFELVLDKIINKYREGKPEIKFINPEIILFPPGKLNLYVIKYQVNKVGIEFYKELQESFSQYISGIKTESWVPHITIGKLRNNKIILTDTLKISQFVAETIKLSGKERCGNNIRKKLII